MRLQCERIKRHLDEHACDWCGAPVYVGDRSYHDEESGGLWCSEGCARADLADGGGRHQRNYERLAVLLGPTCVNHQPGG